MHTSPILLECKGKGKGLRYLVQRQWPNRQRWPSYYMDRRTWKVADCMDQTRNLSHRKLSTNHVRHGTPHVIVNTWMCSVTDKIVHETQVRNCNADYAVRNPHSQWRRRKNCQRWGRKPFQSLPYPSLSSLSISLSLFLFPSLSEEVIQVVDLPHAGVGPHTQDTPFKIKKIPSTSRCKARLLTSRETNAQAPQTLFSFLVLNVAQWVESRDTSSATSIWSCSPLVFPCKCVCMPGPDVSDRTLALAKTDSRRWHAWQT